MRRPSRLGLAAAVLLLVIVLGGYTAFWFYAAGRIENGLGEWALSLRAQNLDLAWKTVRVGGFPFEFAVELNEARLRDLAVPVRGEVAAPLLRAAARPWNFRAWQLAAPGGLSASAGPADAPGARLTAPAATGSVAIAGDGGAAIWLGLSHPSLDAGLHLAAADAEIWLNLPPHPPQGHTEPALGLALAIRGLGLPIVPAPFKNPLDEVSFGVTVKGAVPAAAPRQAAAAWRDAGGTLELDHIAVRWGGLGVSASGTLALDGALQPVGAFSGAVEGYDELMTALVASGRLRASDAGLARMALSLLAKPGPGGRPEIATSFTIQNGQMFLGPAKLGPAPRIEWP